MLQRTDALCVKEGNADDIKGNYILGCQFSSKCRPMVLHAANPSPFTTIKAELEACPNAYDK